jgi:hypothetical protein
MNTLTILWSAVWPTLAIFGSVAAMLFVALIVNLRYAIRTDPERMSAEDAGDFGHPEGWTPSAPAAADSQLSTLKPSTP